MNLEILFFFILGILANFIGTLVGGGGLITLPAMMLFGIQVQFGISLNKFASCLAASTNVLQIIRQNQIRRKTLFGVASLAFAGGICGALVTSNIDEKVLNILVIFLLSFALLITMLKRPPEQENTEGAVEKTSLLQRLLTYCLGVYDGGFGPGSSTLAIMMFLQRGYKYVHSVHLTRTLIVGSNAGALLIYLNNGFLNWNQAIPLGLGSIVGAQLGFLVLPKISQKAAKVILMVITILLIIQIIIKIAF